MIIFDLDGTLWDTTDITLESANLFASSHADVAPFTKEQVLNSMGLGVEDVAKIYMPYLPIEQAVNYMKEVFSININAINSKGAKLYDGVIETIKKLSKFYKLGIVTNNTDDYVKSFLNTSNLKAYFQDYMGATTYNVSKAEAIKIIVGRNNEPNSFYVGDIKKDMIATHDAGIKFIHAKYGFEPDIESKYYINHIKDLENLLQNID